MDIKRSVDESGRSIDAQGKPFSKELFLEGLAATHHSFDENGVWIPPVLIMNPKMWKANEKDFREWEKDPDFVKKHEEIIQKKREDWLAREATRKLVD